MTHSFRSSIYKKINILLDFTHSIDFYRKIHLFFCSSKNENWFLANSEFVDNWVAIENSRIKQFIINFLKKSLKNLIFSLKPARRFKVFFWWPVLFRFFYFSQFLHNLDLPPFSVSIFTNFHHQSWFLSIQIFIDWLLWVVNHSPQLMIYMFFSCSPNIPHGLSRR